jgi:hypothetical protein
MKIEGKYGNIHLIEKKLGNTPRELKDAFPNRKICVCDFYVEGSEHGKLTENGSIHFDDILIIDHHPALPEMRRHISSTTFANSHVTEHGPLDNRFAVLINHTDADSILSALIMCGVLKPREEYNTAAIAADHTGEENIISDLLQALEDDRNLPRSIEVLLRVLEKRLWVRDELKAMVDSHAYNMCGSIPYMILDKKIDAGLLPWFFPDADAIVAGWIMPKGSKGKWGIKTRLGINTDGVALNEMELPDTGGRWDGVSTTRHGGTNTEFEEYVRMVQKKIDLQKRAKAFDSAPNTTEHDG